MLADVLLIIKKEKESRLIIVCNLIEKYRQGRQVAGLIGNLKKNKENMYMSLSHVKGVALSEALHEGQSACVSGRVCLSFISYM